MISPVLFAGALGLLFLAGSAKARPGATPLPVPKGKDHTDGLPGRVPDASAPTPPADLLARIEAAYQSADPAQLRAVAELCLAAGYKDQAFDLRALAAAIEQAQAAAQERKRQGLPPVAAGVAKTIPGPGGGKIVVLPDVNIEARIPPRAPTDMRTISAQRLLAGKMQLNVQTTVRGSENKKLVAEYQQNNNLKADGFYGYNTALSLAQRYGYVPPKPRYWSATSAARDKKAWRDRMLAYAQEDGARRDEWQRAAVV